MNACCWLLTSAIKICVAMFIVHTSVVTLVVWHVWQVWHVWHVWRHVMYIMISNGSQICLANLFRKYLKNHLFKHFRWFMTRLDCVFWQSITSWWSIRGRHSNMTHDHEAHPTMSGLSSGKPPNPHYFPIKLYLVISINSKKEGFLKTSDNRFVWETLSVCHCVYCVLILVSNIWYIGDTLRHLDDLECPDNKR